jgi:hypothetical protein
VNCSGGGNPVSSADARVLLRVVVGLGPGLPPGCDPIGVGLHAALAVPAGNDGIKGDMDCDNDVDAVDALRILRFVAGLDPNLPPDCDPIGQ